MLSLHPAREGVLTNNDWLKRDENFLKKKFQKVLVIKKKVLLLHPLTQRAMLAEKAKIKEEKYKWLHRSQTFVETFIDILDWQHIRIRVNLFRVL
jgi:hypothetical protein